MNGAENYKQQMNKFSAGILLMVVYCFIRINELGNASVLFLFNAKKKEPSGFSAVLYPIASGSLKMTMRGYVNNIE
jgi:hypothetical protein